MLATHHGTGTSRRLRSITVEQLFHAFLEGEHLRPAELVDLAALDLAFDRARHRFGDVADIDRLELGLAAADQRQHRRIARHVGEAVEEAVLRPEIDRRPEDDGVLDRLQHGLFAERLGARIVRFGVQIGAQRRNMGEAGADRARRFGDGAGAELVHGGEFLPAALMQDGDQIDDVVGALHGAVDRPAHAHIGLHRLDLADIAERLQMAGEIGPAAGDPDAVAALGQRPHDVAADKA